MKNDKGKKRTKPETNFSSTLITSLLRSTYPDIAVSYYQEEQISHFYPRYDRASQRTESSKQEINPWNL